MRDDCRHLRPMIIEPDYRGHRIESNAVAVKTRWNAAIRIRRTHSEEKPHIETVTCRKLTPGLAERAGVRWAKRWVDLHSGPA